MAHSSPTTEGFRTAFRRPGLVLAEITWRWVFGAAAIVLVSLSALEFLNTLPVSKEDLFLLRTRHPFLISHAVGHILHGTAHRVVYTFLILSATLALFWILAASFGRLATVKPLIERFGSGTFADAGIGPRFWRTREEGWRLRSLFGLNFLRVVLALAAGLAVVASGVIAGFASSDVNPQPGLVFLIFMMLALVVGLVWCFLNWFLSVAPIFVVGEQQDTFGAISATVDFCRREAGPVFWSSTAFGLLHLVVFVAATSVVVFPLAFAGVVPAGVVIGAIAVLTLIYFAVVDFFHTGRLAAYVFILQRPELPAEPAPPMPSPAPVAEQSTLLSEPHAEAGAWYSTEDDILSDVPGLIPPGEPSR
jgi:hypothetical protein